MDTFISPLSHSLSAIGGLSLLCVGAFLWAGQCRKKSWYIFASGFLLQIVAWLGIALIAGNEGVAVYAIDHPYISFALVLLSMIGTWISAVVLIIIALTDKERS